MSFPFNRKVGYIGFGAVGKSCHSVFQHNFYSIIVDPLKSETTFQQLIEEDPNLVFISLPAPTLDSGTVDSSLIFQTLLDLVDAKYQGLVVVKSTLTPDIVDQMFKTFAKDRSSLRLIYSPEFIREDHWETDARYPSMILLSGNFHECMKLRELYINHSNVDRPENRIKMVDYTAAALAKYTINTFLALKVAFFNQIYQVYSELNDGHVDQDDWHEFISIIKNDDRIGKSHMQVPGPDSQFGYGGRCFPKDVKAFIEFGGEDTLTLLKEAELYNLKRRLQE